jgi:hypothetical protein
MNRLLNRLIIIELFILICLLAGCTYNRTAPLINRTSPLLSIENVGNGSANGNTVTPMP